MAHNFRSTSLSLDFTLGKLQRLIPIAVNELWFCEFLWSDNLSSSCVYFKARETVQSMNNMMAAIHRLRMEKVELVKSDILCPDILRVIFAYTEIFVDFSKIGEINLQFESILERGYKYGNDLCDNFIASSSDSSDSTPEIGRGGPSDNNIDPELPADSQGSKRRLDPGNNISPCVKKQRCNGDMEHKHDTSCWRENSPTVRSSTSTVWRDVKRLTNKCVFAKKYTHMCIFDGDSGNEPCYTVLHLCKAKRKTS